MEQRGNFGSKLGIVLATAGSAVGLGNIWRFPYMTGQNGGAAFLLMYIACIMLLGVPGMMAYKMFHSPAMRGSQWSVDCSSS